MSRARHNERPTTAAKSAGYQGSGDDDVVATLEREAIDKFVASFDELLELIAEKQHTIADAA